MKKILFAVFLISALMLLLPLGTVKNSSKIISASAVKNDEIKIPKKQSTSFKVYNAENDEIKELNSEDYIFGVVAAEMPALYETEALKAQAIAVYTFACCRKAENADKDYDITTDPACDQSYISEQEARARWGDKADEYINKIKSAVNETTDYMITYKGTPHIKQNMAVGGSIIKREL